MQARTDLFERLAEPQPYPELAGLDGVDGVEEPEDREDDERTQNRPAAARNAALKPVASAGEDLLETGGSTPAGSASATRCLTPGTAAAAPSPRIIVPRHRQPLE